MAKKSKAKRFFIVLICLILLAVISFGANVYYWGTTQCKVIDGAFGENTFDSKKFDEGYNELGFITKFFFRSKILDDFAEFLKANPYKNDNPELLVATEELTYDIEAIANALKKMNITEEKDAFTDILVLRYAENVASLKQYEKYNSLHKCMYNNAKVYSDNVLRLLEQAEASDDMTYKNTCYEAAYKDVVLAYDYAIRSCDGDVLANSYCDNLLFVKNALYDITTHGDNKAPETMKTAVDKLKEITDQYTMVRSTVTKIVEGLPDADILTPRVEVSK